MGVRPDAPASVIRAAYRALAMELHPDRNSDKNATSQFQALQEAYAILSDEKARQQYDADSAIPPYHESKEDRAHKKFEPILCSKCGSVSAQPRFKVFYTVFGYIFGATRKPAQGVLCSKCELKVALRSSATTLLTGWWSIHGFFWTLQSLFSNLTGGTFYEQNARLQGYQAMYFAQRGQGALARGVALGALKLAERATKENKNRFGSKRRLGYEEVDALKELKQTLTNFVNSFPSGTAAHELKSVDGISSKRFAYQVFLILGFVALISAEMYREDREAANVERTRLEQQGIERAAAQAIADREAAALKKIEQPLPESGIFHLGDVGSYDPDISPPLKVTNSPDANTLMKLVRVGNGVEAMSIFIRAGQTVEVAVPVGSYRIKLASGRIWYGDTVRFGPGTNYAELDAVFEFKTSGTQLLGHEIMLTRITNGNLKQLPLSAADF